MDHSTTHTHVAKPRPSRRQGLFIHLWTRLMQAQRLRRERSRLSKLDDHMLRDIGLTRDAAATESARPMWDVPAHWQD